MGQTFCCIPNWEIHTENGKFYNDKHYYIYKKSIYIKDNSDKKKKMSYINSLFEIINVIKIKKSDTNKMKHYLSSFNYNIAKNCFFLNLC